MPSSRLFRPDNHLLWMGILLSVAVTLYVGTTYWLDADTSSMAVDDEVVQRANRLLAVYARDLLGEEPAAMRWAFPELSSSSAGT